MRAALAGAACAPMSASRSWMSAMRAGIVRGLRLGQQPRALRVGGQHELDQALGSAGGLLRHRADAGRARDVDGAVVGRKLAGDQAQQRGLARAVAADEADLVARGNAHGRLVEENAAFDAEGEVVDVQHGAQAIAEDGPLVMQSAHVPRPETWPETSTALLG